MGTWTAPKVPSPPPRHAQPLQLSVMQLQLWLLPPSLFPRAISLPYETLNVLLTGDRDRQGALFCAS